MPLTFANIGEKNKIKKIGGNVETKKFLENLGFVVGGDITVVNKVNENVIVCVKESRIAISKDMASKIII